MTKRTLMYKTKDGIVVIVYETLYRTGLRWSATSRINLEGVSLGVVDHSEFRVYHSWRWVVLRKIRRVHRAHVQRLEKVGLL